MSSIIGLFRGEEDIKNLVQRLAETGHPDNRIDVFTEESAIRKLLGCEPTCVVTRYAVLGASLGIAVYALFGLFAGLCQCNLLHYGQVYGVGTFLGGILAGAFVGGVIGGIIGAAEYEEGSHLYVQGARLGGKVIVVQAGEEDVESLKLLMEQEKASGVKLL